MIQRYDFLYSESVHLESIDGEWVKYNDIEWIIKDNQNLYKILQSHINFTNALITITNTQNKEMLTASNNFQEFLNRFDWKDK